MKKIMALLLAVLMLLSLCACAPKEENLAEAGGTRVFVDDCGREVEIPAEICRIVPSGALAQIILFAIAPDMFVGLADEFEDSARGIIAEEYFALPFFGALYTGNEMNLEELALAAPDILIDMGDVKDGVAGDMDALQEQTAIPSIFIHATLESMPETYRSLGKLLGREERAEELATFCERVYDRTVSIMEDVGENKVKALYVLGEEGLNVIASGSYHAELIDLLTDNLAIVDNPISKGSGNEVSMEQIALWNPAFIIFGPGSIYGDVAERATWTEVNAVANGSFVEVPDEPYNWMSMPPSVQRYLGLIWLTAELYPDYCDYDVKAEIMEYYELFYGCSLTDEQYDSITANAFRR